MHVLGHDRSSLLLNLRATGPSPAPRPDFACPCSSITTMSPGRQDKRGAEPDSRGQSLAKHEISQRESAQYGRVFERGENRRRNAEWRRRGRTARRRREVQIPAIQAIDTDFAGILADDYKPGDGQQRSRCKKQLASKLPTSTRFATSNCARATHDEFRRCGQRTSKPCPRGIIVHSGHRSRSAFLQKHVSADRLRLRPIRRKITADRAQAAPSSSGSRRRRVRRSRSPPAAPLCRSCRAYRQGAD